MRVTRLFLESDCQTGQTIALPKEQAHYALTVLRLKDRSTLELFNGQGQLATGTLLVTGRRTAEVHIVSVTHTNCESPLNSVLVQAISKGDRMETSIQKSVELGVTAIQPIFTEHSAVKLEGDKLEKRRQQWQSIVINACEQSGRTVVPKVLPILTYQAWLESTDHSKVFGLVLDPYAPDSLRSVQPPEKGIPIYLLVGPEGGLSQQEVTLATERGLTPIQLGPRVLRTETAGPAILAGLQLMWGDF